MFPDSTIACKFGSIQTKTAMIAKNSNAPHLHCKEEKLMFSFNKAWLVINSPLGFFCNMNFYVENGH